MWSAKSFFDRLRAFWRTTAAPKLSSAMGWIAVLYVAVTMFIEFDQDTTDVSGAAFVVASILAGLAFTYAGAIPESDGDKDDVIFSGERLCQGAMLFLIGSLLKYGSIALPAQLDRLPLTSVDRSSIDFLVLGLQGFLFLVFLAALLVSQLGYGILGRVLMKRMARKGKAIYFPPLR